MDRFFNAVLFFFLFFICSSAYSQDEHFSQFYAFPLHLNPAMTGAYDGTYRLTAINRDQWNNKLESPYRTFAAGGDTRINMKIRQRDTKDKIGIGLFFVSDQVALYQANTNKLSSYFSYHKRLGNKNVSYLGAGIKLGIVQRNINYDNLTFDDQFNQVDAFDQSTSEFLPPNNFGNFDASIGLNYYVQMDKSTYYVGAALHHFNKPNFSYFSKIGDSNLNPNIDVSQVLNSKIVAHVSLDRKLSYTVTLQPRFVFQKQGEQNQFDLGSNIEYTLKSRDNAVILGLWLTALDDLDGAHLENLTPLLGIRHKRFILGLSYDVHLRDALNSTFGFNTFEFSLRFSGETEKSGAYCPTF